MYDVIKMTQGKDITESFDFLKLDVPNSNGITQDQFYQEAVFTKGKEKVGKIVEIVTEIKELLESEISKQQESDKSATGKKFVFDPENFWKNKLFKDLEDEFEKVFGFRYAEIQPLKEKYISGKDVFESYEINAWVYNTNRFPVEGLVTDDGFFDESHSLTFSMMLTLGLIKLLEPEELVAVILHEFGHKIDPALTTITYTQTNILSKYLTDRTNKLTENEKRLINDMKKYTDKKNLGTLISLILVMLFASIFLYAVKVVIIDPIKWAISKILPKKWQKKIHEKRMKKIQAKVAKLIKKYDKDLFTRQNYSEAYADNFARMYGFGPQLASSFHKMSKKTNDNINSYIKREHDRSRVILNITECLLKDEHKTDVHRIRSLIKEYKKDITDPNTPDVVKKQLEDDVKELEIVLDKFLNDFSEVQNRVNQMINDNITALEEEEEKKEKDKKEKDNK